MRIIIGTVLCVLSISAFADAVTYPASTNSHLSTLEIKSEVKALNYGRFVKVHPSRTKENPNCHKLAMILGDNSSNRENGLVGTYRSISYGC